MKHCTDCPIKGTEYCHKVNPMAKKYTRAEKNELREAIDKGTNYFQGCEVMKTPKLIFCECCGERKPWSTIYHGLQSRGNLMAVCPACKKYLDQKDKEAK